MTEASKYTPYNGAFAQRDGNPLRWDGNALAASYRRVVVVGCFLSMFLCYVDRVGFSIAFTSLADASGISEIAKGYVMSAFFYGYAVSQFPGGILAHRFGGHQLLTACFLSWGIATLLLPMSGGRFAALVIGRLGVGVSQGLMVPSVHATLAKWVLPAERAMATSLTTSGMYLGSALAMLYLPALAHRVGPAAVTKLSGASGLVWAALWASLGLLMPETAPKPALASLPDPEAPEPSEGAVGPVDTRLQDKGEYPTIGRSNAPQIDPAALRGGVRGPRSNAEGVGVAQGTAHSNAPRSNIFGAVERWVWGHRVGDSDKLGEKGIRASSQTLMGRVTLAAELLRHPAIVAICVNNFTFHYTLYMLMNWLPTFFSAYLGGSLAAMGNAKVLPYLIMFATSNLGGWLGDRLVFSMGWRVAAARKGLNTAGMVGASVGVMLMPLSSGPRVGVVTLAATFAFQGLSRAGFSVNHMDVAPRHASIVMGLSNTFGTLSGIIGVALTGWLLEAWGGASEGGGWVAAHAVCALVMVAGSVVFVLHARGEPVAQ